MISSNTHKKSVWNGSSSLGVDDGAGGGVVAVRRGAGKGYRTAEARRAQRTDEGTTEITERTETRRRIKG